MAANKFATKLSRNTNKITVVLVYAALEWVLIVLLLLNSLFSYLIIKFTDYFGLKRPCLWCSRLDHVFEPEKFHSSYRSLVCESHAIEISKLGYCLSHHKLSEAQGMCEDCSSSLESDPSKRFAFFPWMKQIGFFKDCSYKENEEFELILRCSCCGADVDRKLFCDDYYLIKPSWVDSDCITLEGDLDLKEETNHEVHQYEDPAIKNSDFVSNIELEEEKQRTDDNRGIEVEKGRGETGESTPSPVSKFNEKEMVANDDTALDTITQELQELVNHDDGVLSVEDPSRFSSDNGDTSGDIQPRHIEFYIEGEDFNLIPIEERLVANDKKEEEEEEEIHSNEDIVMVFNKEGVGVHYELIVDEMNNSDEDVPLLLVRESDEEPKAAGVEISSALSNQDVHENSAIIGDLIELDNDQDIVCHGILHYTLTEEHKQDVSMGIGILETGDDLKTTEVERRHHNSAVNNDNLAEDEMVGFITVMAETTEMEEDKFLYIPSSEINLDLERKIMLFQRREKNPEEPVDGSVMSDIEMENGVLTVEKLKILLREKTKALNALYEELEVERSASAVAANETMAMINRLQEEKAIMQMEYLQYLRLMEEQFAYREQEKAGLENELQLYRKKLEVYEVNETNGCLDNHDQECSNPNTPVDDVSFFEEERVSILGQVKGLQQKLFMLSDDDEDNGHCHEENGNGYLEEDGVVNDHWKGLMNGKYCKGGAKARTLLPLFDAQIEDGVLSEQVVDSKRFAIEEEVDHVYERLRALEEHLRDLGSMGFHVTSVANRPV